MLKKLTTVFVVFASMCGVMAEVPSLINYQGKLSDKDGAPVNGDKNFTVRIFDANEGGKQVYEEAIGVVSVKDGLYSFGFGEAGKSVATATETMASADGTTQVFNYIVKNTPVLGGIKISGGSYSWTESGGSSDAGNFTATANKESGAVSAIFLAGNPEAGQQIKIEYNHSTDGVMGALSRGGQAWLEITVGGETLSPRERLVSVPFALKAKQLISPIELPLLIESYFTPNRHIGTLHTKTEVNIFSPQVPGFRQLQHPRAMQYFFVPKGISKLKIRFYNLGISGGANSQNILDNQWKGYGLILPLNTEEVTYIENPDGGEDNYTRYNLTVINNVKEGLYRVDAILKDFFYDIDNVSSGNFNKTNLSGSYGIVITGEQ